MKIKITLPRTDWQDVENLILHFIQEGGQIKQSDVRWWVLHRAYERIRRRTFTARATPSVAVVMPPDELILLLATVQQWPQVFATMQVQASSQFFQKL